MIDKKDKNPNRSAKKAKEILTNNSNNYFPSHILKGSSSIPESAIGRDFFLTSIERYNGQNPFEEYDGPARADY